MSCVMATSLINTKQRERERFERSSVFSFCELILQLKLQVRVYVLCTILYIRESANAKYEAG